MAEGCKKNHGPRPEDIGSVGDVFEFEIGNFRARLCAEHLPALELEIRNAREEHRTMKRRERQAMTLIHETDLLRADPGAVLTEFATDLCVHAARFGRPVRGVFNGTELKAHPKSSPSSVFEQWEKARRV
jgi:hypothetical protein